MTPEPEHRAYIRQLRDIIEQYACRRTGNMPDTQRYLLLYDCLNHARQELRKKLPMREIYHAIAATFGCSTQTLYRARAAMRSYSWALPPRKYAIKTYNNIYIQIDRGTANCQRPTGDDYPL